MPPQQRARRDKAANGAALKALAKVCHDVRPGEPEEGVLGVVPGTVAAPATVAEAAGVMRVAAEKDLAVVPRGAETRLDWGTPPARCDLLLDTAGLNRVIEHAAGDLVVKAEAGLGTGELAGVLAEQRQRLALDTPLPGSTVGGTVATAAAGPLRLQYGSPRDLVIGLTVVRADGQVARSGGKVVKNVAGYDLGRLFSGSYGTLGLIVEATFRLHPVPVACAYLTCTVPDGTRAHEVVQAVLHSPAAPSALECSATGGTIRIGVLLEGVDAGVAARTDQVRALMGDGTKVSETAPDWWGAYPDGTTLIDLTAPPAALPSLLSTAGDAASLSWSAAGRGYLGLPGGDTAPEQVAHQLSDLRSLLDGRPHRGSAVVRYAPEAVRTEVDLWGPVPALSLMRRVKEQFDPGYRMSPGRFVGGL